MTTTKRKRKLRCQAPDCPVALKRSFWSEDAARFFMNAFGNTRVYKCPECGFWHLSGSRLKGKRKGKK